MSTVIGAFMSAMGAGAWMARRLKQRVADRYVEAQVASYLFGGLSGPILYLAFAFTNHGRLVLFLCVGATGIFVGACVPLLVRITQTVAGQKDLVARILSLDYVGALLGSLLFALVALPSLGAMRTGIVFGILGLLAVLAFYKALGEGLDRKRVRWLTGGSLIALAVALGGASWLVSAVDNALLAQPVAFAQQTNYQRIVITHAKRGINLWLDGNLQFSASDEYRYHEALVHPAIGALPRRKRILVLGGGDGLAVREVLKYPDVESVTLVDLDEQMTRLARDLPDLRHLNQDALRSERVHVVNDDAMVWLDGKDAQSERYDGAIVDFPDPNSFALGKLYTVHFYKLLRSRLTPEAVVSVQATSPLVAPRSYWCVVRTMEAAGFSTRPYHAFVPAFGEWGYVLAAPEKLPATMQLPGGLRFLNQATLENLFEWPIDMQAVDVELNRLNNQSLVRYYEEEWQRWMH
jgi:spermidine synthase